RASAPRPPPASHFPCTTLFRSPQPTVDTLAQLENLGDAVAIQKGDTLTWEHLDFNFAEGNAMTNLELRKAFAMCVPRQQIVDNLDRKSTRLNSSHVSSSYAVFC